MCYIPLFMSMHDNIVDNPLDMSDQKYSVPPRTRPVSAQRDMNPLGFPLSKDSSLQVSQGFKTSTTVWVFVLVQSSHQLRKLSLILIESILFCDPWMNEKWSEYHILSCSSDEINYSITMIPRIQWGNWGYTVFEC